MKYMGDIKTFYLNIMNYGRKNVFPFKRNAEFLVSGAEAHSS